LLKYSNTKSVFYPHGALAYRI